MLKKLLNKSKAVENEFLKELLNPETTNDKLNKLFKDYNIDLNELYFNDEFILHYCCKKDLFKSVLWLITNGINIEIENEKNETALFYAINSRSSAILQILIENNVNINHLNINKRTALQEAVISANNRIVNFLIEIEQDLSNCDLHGNNLIFDAIANGNFDIIRKISIL